MRLVISRLTLWLDLCGVNIAEPIERQTNREASMKRIMQIIKWGFALLVIGLSSLSLQAQTAPADTTMNTVGMDFKNNTYYAVGANIGLLSGAGLAARASFPGGFAAQLALLP